MANWDEANPGDSDIVSQYPQNARAFRSAAKTNLGVNHHEVDDADVGKHEAVALLVQGADPAAVAGEGQLYTKDVGAGVIEAFYRDEAGNVIRLTRDNGVDAFLAGVTDPAVGRSSLGLVIGTDVQAFDQQLADIAAMAPADGAVLIGDGTTFVLESGADFRTSIGAVASARAVNTGSGCDGGGDLTADRTITVGAGNGLNQTATGLEMSGTYTGTFNATVDVGVTSDRRLKTNLRAADWGALLGALQPWLYTRIANGQDQYGFIAQELEWVVPEAVTVPHDPDKMRTVSYQQIIPITVGALQEVLGQIAQLEARVQDLEARVAP